MKVEYDADVDFFDVFFNGDLCEYCIHADYCTYIKSLQTGLTTLNNTQPIEYCAFFTGRTLTNTIINFFKRKKVA